MYLGSISLTDLNGHGWLGGCEEDWADGLDHWRYV